MKAPFFFHSSKGRTNNAGTRQQKWLTDGLGYSNVSTMLGSIPSSLMKIVGVSGLPLIVVLVKELGI